MNRIVITQTIDAKGVIPYYQFGLPKLVNIRTREEAESSRFARLAILLDRDSEDGELLERSE